MSVTLKDIANAVGCSSSIVSEVLNNTGRQSRVSTEKREQIIETAARMNYRSNLNAKRLAGKSTRTIGLIVSPQLSPLGSELVFRLSKCLSLNGYSNYSSFPMNAKEELAAIENFISLGFDGILLNHTFNVLEHSKYPIPIVAIGATENKFDISSDVHYGEYMATRHLLNHGHRKIGFFCDRQRSNQRKFNGYTSALEEKNISAGSAWVLEFLDNNDFMNDLERLLKKEKVTAFVTTGDITAGRLMAFLISRGYRVPEDVAITGYDGNFMVEMTACPLTSVVMPLRELAAQSVELLMHKIGNNIKTQTVPPKLVKPCLFIGGSCGCPRHVPNNTTIYRDLPMTIESAAEMMQQLPPEQREDYRFEY